MQTPQTAITLRPYASPLPLGFFAFAVGTVLLSALELHWVPESERLVLALIMIAFAAPLEGVASVFAFLTRDTAAATLLGVFSAGWAAVGLVFLATPAATSAGLGAFLLCDSVVVLALALAAVSGKPFFTTILLLACARFVLAGLFEVTGSEGLSRASGIVGLVIGLVAVYGGLALLLEDMQQKTVLPLFRRGASRQALEGSLADQLSRIEHDAGVRQRL